MPCPSVSSFRVCVRAVLLGCALATVPDLASGADNDSSGPTALPATAPVAWPHALSASPGTRAAGRTWRVAPGRRLARPSDAARVARPGDTVEVAAGRYVNDFAHWRQDGLTLRAVGGQARLVASARAPNGKGIWVVSGDDIHVEGFAFEGARVTDGNGAGIRAEGGRLRVARSSFRNNELGLLAGTPDTDIEIVASEFAHHRREGRYTHAVYVAGRRLAMRYSYLHHTHGGHHVKSRAQVTDLRYNRLSDEAEGAASYLVDIPNCGDATVVGNVLHKGPAATETIAIAYGAEGQCRARGGSLRVAYNSYLHSGTWFARLRGSFVRNFSRRSASLVGNVVAGAGAVSRGAQVSARGNLVLRAAQFVDADALDLRLRGEPSVRLPTTVTAPAPRFEYRHPLSYAARADHATPGAFER